MGTIEINISGYEDNAIIGKKKVPIKIAGEVGQYKIAFTT